MTLAGRRPRQYPPGAKNARRDPIGALALALLTAGTSCTTTAQVARRSGPDEVGWIARSDEGALYIDEDGTGRTVRIAREDVRDVDHPGNGLMVAGGILLGLWGLLMINTNFRHGLIDAGNLRGSDAAGGLPVTVGLVVPGALMFSIGALKYGQSKRAAARFEDATGRQQGSTDPAAPPPGVMPAGHPVSTAVPAERPVIPSTSEATQK